MNNIRNSVHSKGFALPTVMIASVVMLMVLLSGLVASSSINTALRTQYNAKVLQLATEAGKAMVNACLAKSYNVPGWTDPLKPLKPNTDCSGNVIGGASQYVLDSPKIKTTFEVPPIVVENGTQRANIKGILQAIRTSGTPNETTDMRSILVGSQNSFSNVMFGYCTAVAGCEGSQLAVVLATGEVKTLGKNENGRLGVGSIGDRTTPGTFILPANERGVAAFSNFLSVGRQISVMTANGKVYSAGSNDYGQLGAVAANPSATPVQFGTIGNGAEKAAYVGMTNYNTFVMTNQNNIYSAGLCDWGMLGWGCSSGTSSTATRVSLPSPTADLNTQPATTSTWAQSDNLVMDRVNIYVRMKGGAVYGWGANDRGQLGNGTLTTATTPIKIGTFGNVGQPAADKIGFDGETLIILDTTGALWTVGSNTYGMLAGAGGAIQAGSGLCMDNPWASTTNGNRQAVTTCNQTVAQKYEWHSDGTLRVNGKCVDNTGGSSADSNPIQIWDCNGNAAQQWTMNNDKSIRNPATGKCIDNPFNSTTPGNLLLLNTCNGTPAQQWTLAYTSTPQRVPVPASAGKIVKFTTDQWSVIMIDENGEAWAAGANDAGQLANGQTKYYSPQLTKVTGIPAGRKIIDVYTTKYGGLGSGIANTYFVLDDGTVRGSGYNNYGQLGTGSVTGIQTTAVQMQGFPPGTVARSVQTGYGTTVVITSDGKVYTLGNNSNGQLGDGTINPSSVPRANQYTNQRSTISY